VIRRDEVSGLWFLEVGDSQAVIGLYAGRWPVLYHWGSPIDGGDLERIPAAANGFSVFGGGKTYTPHRLPLEYPGPDAGDFRSPAFIARTASGTPALEPACSAWRIDEGRDLGALPGALLPEHAPTLVLTLTDAVTGFEAELRYTPLDRVLLRSVRLTNRGAEPLVLDRVFSFSADLHPDRELDIVALDGAWARERQLSRFDLPAGRWETGSRRGVSSHQAWPGVVLAERAATEDQGQVWGAALIWSGDWTLGAERDEDGGWRFQGGLHPELAARTLATGASFTTPEAVLVHSANGLSGLSAAYHSFVIDRLLPPAWAKRPRPVVANNWEATYWAFTEDKLLALADEAAAVGVEVFVLDDGWFGRRDDDRSSLGDWTPHSGKFRHGLAAFAREIEKRGLGFGLWIEPEMVSADSDLYRAHPDWCLHLEGRPVLEGRHQLVLDLSRAEVRDHLAAAMTGLLSSAPVSYVKWDMNRPLAHAGARRFDWVLGLYELLGTLTSRFPEVLFEGCCGGGGRMDFGLLSFTPQFWTSDNTDAVARLGIQEGTSVFLPPVVMGAHVSAVPNHQTGRVTSLDARVRAACAGNLGYELDFTKLDPEEKRALTAATAWYRRHRRLIQQGRFTRTRTSLEDPNAVAWQIGNDEETILFWFRPSAVANTRQPAYRWTGIETAAVYEVRVGFDGEPVRISGSELTHRGLPLPVGPGDAAGVVVHARRVEPT
jgi:alpha-galactosidase